MADLFSMIFEPAKMLGSMIFSANQNNRNQHHQWDMLNAQQDWTTSEREAMQDYNTSERLSAQQYNQQMWQMNADWNSVGAQKQRAIAAGINPNSVLGNTAVESPVTTTAQSAPSGEVVGAPGSPTQYDLGRLFADNIDSAYENILKAHQAKQVDRQTTLTEAQIHNVMADTSVKDSVKRLNDSQRKQIDELLPHLVGKTSNEAKLIYQQALKVVEEITLVKQEVKNAHKQESVLEAEAQLKGEQAKESKERANLLSFEALGQREQNAILKAKADLAREGIIVDGHWLFTLVSLLSTDNGSKAIDNIFKHLGDVVSSLAKGVINAPKNILKSLFRFSSND